MIPWRKPSYWTQLSNETDHLQICNPSFQLKKIYEHIQTPMAVLSNNTSPCVALLIPLTVEKDDLDDKNDIGSYGISIIYSTTEYQEIVNLQDFDFNSAFSGIGGFIGIFCGYALFQVPEIFDVTNLSMLSTMFLTSCSSSLFSNFFCFKFRCRLINVGILLA